MNRVGERHHFAKLTEDTVRRMRARRAEGATLEQIHAELGQPAGVTHSQTEKIVYGLAWKHVT